VRDPQNDSRRQIRLLRQPVRRGHAGESLQRGGNHGRRSRYFRALLEHVYAGIDPPFEIALDTLDIADKYGLKHLKRLCEGLVFTDLSCDFYHFRGDDKVVDVLIVADRVGCKDLKERAMAILSAKFQSASREERAKLMNDPILLLQLFVRCVTKNIGFRHLDF